MKKAVVFSLLFSVLPFAASSDETSASGIGTFRYSVSMEKDGAFQSLGSAVFTMEKKDGIMLSTSAIKFSVNNVEMMMNQTIEEKDD